MNGIAFRNLKIKKIIYEDSLQKVFLCKHQEDNSTYMVNAIINRKPYELVDFNKINGILSCFEYIYEEEEVLYLITKGQPTFEIQDFLKTHKFDELMKIEHCNKILVSLNQLKFLPIHILCSIFNKHNIVVLENGNLVFLGLLYFEKNYLELDFVVLMNHISELIELLFKEDEELPSEIKDIIEKCQKRRYKNYNTILTDFEAYSEKTIKEIEKAEKKQRKTEQKKTETKKFFGLKEKDTNKHEEEVVLEKNNEYEAKADDINIETTKSFKAKTVDMNHTIKLDKNLVNQLRNEQKRNETAEGESSSGIYDKLLKNAAIKTQATNAVSKKKMLDEDAELFSKAKADIVQDYTADDRYIVENNFEIDDDKIQTNKVKEDEKERLVDAFFKGKDLDYKKNKSDGEENKTEGVTVKNIALFFVVMIAMVTVLFMVYKFIMNDTSKLEDSADINKMAAATDIDSENIATTSESAVEESEQPDAEGTEVKAEINSVEYSKIVGVDLLKDDEMKNFLTEDLWQKSESANLISIDGEVKHAGTSSLKLANENGSEQDYYIGGIEISKDSSKKELKPEIRLWIQSQKEQSAILYAKVYKDGELVVKISRKVFVAADNWMQYDMELNIGAGDYIQLYAKTFDAGNIWLDDYNVTYK